MQASEALRQAIDEIFHSGWDKQVPLRFLLEQGWQIHKDVLTPPERPLSDKEITVVHFLTTEHGLGLDYRPPPGSCPVCGRASLSREDEYCSIECRRDGAER